MTIVVEPAVAADAAGIRALDGLGAATGRLLDAEFGRSDRCAVVARTAGEVAGVGEVVGYAAAACHLDEAEILDVVVTPAWRGRGVGTRLVATLLAQAQRRGAVAATLEVREGNAAALALYRHLGFVVEGRRPGYYPDGEAALIMWSGHGGTERT